MFNGNDYNGGGCTLRVRAHGSSVPPTPLNRILLRSCGACPALCDIDMIGQTERRYTISYINAEDILPAELVSEIRKYIEGEAIYIPRAVGRAAWGGSTGTRAELDRRNRAIRAEYDSGIPVPDLSRKYCLSTDSIRKILRKT